METGVRTHDKRALDSQSTRTAKALSVMRSKYRYRTETECGRQCRRYFELLEKAASGYWNEIDQMEMEQVKAALCISSQQFRADIADSVKCYRGKSQLADEIY